MKWAVYWQHEDEIECRFFKAEAEARNFVKQLITDCENAAADRDGELDWWDITLLKVIGEVRPVPFDGELKLSEVA